MPVAVHTSTTWFVLLLPSCVSANTLCGCSQFYCPIFSRLHQSPQALFGATVSHCTMLLGLRFPKTVADLSFFSLLTCFFTGSTAWAGAEEER